MENFGREPVADIDHRTGNHAGFLQCFHRFYPCFGLELPFDEVGEFAEVGLHFRMLEEDAFFAFQDLQSEIGGAQVAAHAEDIAGFGAAAVGNAIGRNLTYDADMNHQSFRRSGCIAAHQCDAVAVAGESDSGIQFIHRFNRKTIAESQPDGDGRCFAVHGADIAHIAGNSLEPEMAQGHIRQVEMDPFGQGIGTPEQVMVSPGL